MISHVTVKSFLKSTSVWSHGLRCFSISLLTSLLLCPPSYKATTPFCNQVVNLQALPSEEADPVLALLCPVRALRIYVDRTRREGCLQTEAGPLDSGCRRLGVPISRRAVPPVPPFMRWRTVPLWQTSAELRAGQHRTPSQDSTVSVLSQSLPVCWVTVMSGKSWPVSCLLRHSPSPGDTSALFLLQFSSLDSEPWWNPPSTPGSQTGRSSLTPGPVLVLARPGLQSAPVLG